LPLSDQYKIIDIALISYGTMSYYNKPMQLEKDLGYSATEIENKPERQFKTSRGVFFQGQGTQRLHMGMRVYEVSTAARRVYQAFDETLGFSVRDKSFHDPDKDLYSTTIAQLAVSARAIACYEAMREEEPGFESSVGVFMGHSLGEYMAYYAAGVISLSDTIRAIYARGEAYKYAIGINPGVLVAMSIIPKEKNQPATPEEIDRLRDVVSDLIDGEFYLSADNDPTQLVIGGSKQAFNRHEERIKRLRKERIKGKLLPVDGAPHTPLMEPAVEKFLPVFRALEIRSSNVPLILNVKANVLRENDPLTRPLLEEEVARQMVSPVLWRQGVEHSREGGITETMEIGVENPDNDGILSNMNLKTVGGYISGGLMIAGGLVTVGLVWKHHQHPEKR